MNKEITPATISRANRYHNEFATFMTKFYAKHDSKKQARLEFIERHKDNYPALINPVIHFRIAVRPYFDKNIYSLRDIIFNDNPKADGVQTNRFGF